jgi:hypothetical protein
LKLIYFPEKPFLKDYFALFNLTAGKKDGKEEAKTGKKSK